MDQKKFKELFIFRREEEPKKAHQRVKITTEESIMTKQ